MHVCDCNEDGVLHPPAPCWTPLLPWLFVSSRMFDHFSGSIHYFKALFLVSALNSMAECPRMDSSRHYHLHRSIQSHMAVEDQLLSKQTLGGTGMGLQGRTCWECSGRALCSGRWTHANRAQVGLPGQPRGERTAPARKHPKGLGVPPNNTAPPLGWLSPFEHRCALTKPPFHLGGDLLWLRVVFA